jgi:hypothetical protein
MSGDESEFFVVLQDGSTTFKLRVHFTSTSAAVAGNEIASAILCHPKLTFDVTDATVDVYDAISNTFFALEEQNNVVQRFGRRLRCSLQRPPDSQQVLQIAGRFFHYDKGMTLANARVEVWELPNKRGAGTGLSVWDGSILL